MKYSHIFYILFIQLLLLFLAIFIIYDIKFIHIENSYLIKDSLLIASYIAQCGIFLIAIYTISNNKQKLEDIKLYNMCCNLIKVYNYVDNWINIIKTRSFDTIEPKNINAIKDMYIKNDFFITHYKCEHEKIERTLGILKFKYLNFFYLIRTTKYINDDDINSIIYICNAAKLLKTLENSLRKYTIYNKENQNSTSNNIPNTDNLVTQKRWKESIDNIGLYEINLTKVERVIDIINSSLPKNMKHIISKRRYL